ncbi:1,4-alpha-glucan branching protein GlgB [bacterium]|nr:1,4-alpha-glucan branching protein GlgB [bacterium]
MTAPVSLTDYDIYLQRQGTFYRSYEKFGAHPASVDGRAGTRFALWAPNAREVSVVGDFNQWSPEKNKMAVLGDSGVWECFIPGIGPGETYKYLVASQCNDSRAEKADPYGFAAEVRPKSASRVWDLSKYVWGDRDWMSRRGGLHRLDSPISIYEVHLGSWMRVPEDGNRWLTYREAAARLADYVSRMGYTHVEFLPLAEHALDISWGYQTIGYFAPTSRFGTPDDFMFLVDTLHQAGIGVLLDWVPAHFPKDGHGLGLFDGTHLYEHDDPRQGEHPDWGTYVFNFGRTEVANFLISNALFWLDKYHIDGLRVDAVASMIYLDYSRKEGEWVPNEYGGRENLGALAFLRRLNETVYKEYPDTLTMAEESTSWPMVSRPTYLGGLGFGYKWDMGWMHDTLDYMSKDPVYRKFSHDRLTFRMLYAWFENYVLPLSHDEVCHGKGSLLNKMPGDDWQKMANFRAMTGYMFAQPGKKLLFMGADIGQWREWNCEESLEWHLMDFAPHQGINRWIRDLNTFYRGERALHGAEVSPEGFEWVDCNDGDNSVISLLRKAPGTGDPILLVFNFTPLPRHTYAVGVPRAGHWQEVLNSDASIYGGSGQQGNPGGVTSVPIPTHGRDQCLYLTIPPLGMLAFKPA